MMQLLKDFRPLILSGIDNDRGIGGNIVTGCLRHFPLTTTLAMEGKRPVTENNQREAQPLIFAAEWDSGYVLPQLLLASTLSELSV